MTTIPKVVYIAGPIKDNADFRADFGEAEKLLLAEGHVVLNPARMGQGEHPYEWYVRESMKLLIAADVIYLLRGWEWSRGALLEFQVAVACGMEVRFE